MTKLLIIVAIVITTISCNSTKNTTSETDDIANKETVVSQEESIKQNTQARDAQLIEKGFDFVAFGNEPFWILRIDFDKKLAEFEQMGQKIYSFRTENDDRNQIEEIEYQSNNADLMVQAQENNCYDNMSGEGFTYEINVIINGKEMRGCGKYLGEDNTAGRINTDLFGTWMLRQLNDTILPKESKTRLNLDNQFHIGGFSSCNMYNGSYKVDKNTIKFSDILMTQMYCANSIEVEYMDALAKANTYKIEKNRLTVFDKNQKLILIFDN